MRLSSYSHRCYILPDNTRYISIIVLERKKDNIVIKERKTGLKSLEELETFLPPKSPVCLSIDGKGVIVRKLPVDETNKDAPQDDLSLLNQALPNTSLDDFVIQSHETEKNNLYVSLVRQDILNEYIDFFKDKSFFVVNLVIGPFSMNKLYPLLQNDVSIIDTGDVKIESNGSQITGFSRKHPEDTDKLFFQLGNEQISNFELLPFGVALPYFTDDQEGNVLPKIQENQKEFFYKNFFVKTGWSMIIFLLAAVMLNFYFYNNYKDQNGELSFKLSRHTGLLAKLDTLTKESAFKEELIKQSGFLKSSRLTLYADQIAESVPSSILLTNLNINPLKKKMKEGEKPNFINNDINVIGMARYSTDVNNWIAALKDIDWINNVEILEYTREKAGEPGEFELNITINKR